MMCSQKSKAIDLEKAALMHKAGSNYDARDASLLELWNASIFRVRR